jgi:addiction module HigA family antidote
VIKSFADKNTKEFWETGKSRGMPPANLRKVAKRKLAAVHSAVSLEDLRIPPGIVSIKNEGPAGWAVHPGEMLREEFLRPLGISAYKLSVELGVSAPTVNDIVREKRGITPEMAARLARYFGTSEQFWLNLQDAFAVHQVKKKYSRELRAIKPLAAAASR